MKEKITKIALIVLIAICAIIWINNRNHFVAEETSKEKSEIAEWLEKTDKTPTASLIVKDKNVFIEIKNLELTTDQANRLKREIERKVKLDKFPKDWKINMNIKITDSMLRRAGIYSRESEHHGLSNDEEENDYETEKHFSRDGNSKVKIFHDMKVGKGENLESVVVISGNLDFEGEADEVVVIFGDAKIHPSARINQNLVVLFGSSDISPEAQISGEQVTIEAGKTFRNILMALAIPGALISMIAFTPFLVFFKFLMWFVIFGFALLLFHIFPETTKRSKDYLKTNLLPSLGFGVLGLLLIIPFFLFLLLSIIGIPLIPIFAILLTIVLFGGYAIIAHYIGMLLPIKSLTHSETWGLLFGIIMLGFVSFIPVLGCILRFIALTFGFGAVSYNILQMIFRRKQMQTPLQPPPADVQS